MRLWSRLRSRRMRHRLASFVCYRTSGRFYAIATRQPAQTATVPTEVVCYQADAPAPTGVLEAVKGEPANWAERWARGHLCAAAWVDGQPVAFIWLARDGWRLVDSDAPRPLPPGGAWLYDAVTLPGWRGRRLQHVLIHAVLTAAAEEGLHTAYALSADKNRLARRSLLSQGFTELDGWVRVYRLLMLFRWRSVRVPWSVEAPPTV